MALKEEDLDEKMVFESTFFPFMGSIFGNN